MKILGDGGLPSHDARRWQSGPHLRVSLQHLRAILDYLKRNEVRMYRIATALAPYASHPKLTQFHGQIEECEAELADLGQVIRQQRVRLSSHPGQYTVLNSEKREVRNAASAELEVQASLLDAMNLPDEAVVVIHVGSRAGGIRAASDRFLLGFEELSEPARRRLAVENDDRLFSLADVLRISERCGIKVVWDVLHHRCHDPEAIPDREALERAASTWRRDTIPKIHYSSPRLDVTERRRKRGRRVERQLVLPKLRAHADLVDPIGFEHFLLDVGGQRDFDVMLEAKAKDLALLRLLGQLRDRGLPTGEGAVVIDRRQSERDAEPETASI